MASINEFDSVSGSEGCIFPASFPRFADATTAEETRWTLELNHN
jgi:hypothetical protein